MDDAVFNDASGSRASALQWGGRIVLAVVILLGTALALTLRTHVTVPGLDRLVPPLQAEVVRPVAPPRAEPVEAGDTQALPTSRPATPAARPPSSPDPAPARSGQVRPAAGPATAVPVAQPTSAPRASASAGAQAAPKPRNPKAATPSPHDGEPPGQSRRPKPRSATDVN